MASREFMADATTRNAIFLQRKAGGDVKAVVQLIDALERAMLGAVATGYSSIRQQALALEVASMAAEAYQEIGALIAHQATETAEYMIEFEAKLLEAGAKAATIAQPALNQGAVMAATFNARPGVAPITIQRAISAYGEQKAAEARTIITDAILANKTRHEATADLSAALRVGKRQAEVLVRTSMNSAAQTGRLATLAANSELLQGYEWVAKLDARTTLVCAGRDGEIYPLGGGPVPPAHYGCRSQIVPALLPEFNRADLTGAPPEQTYADWLKGQSASFQDEVLGKQRAELFRDGGLPINRFTNDAGRTYTLEELRELEPLAFERAGIDDA